MQTRSYYPVLLAVFMIGSVVSQNVDELPTFVESDNLFPPERSESNSQNEGSEITTTEPTQGTSEYTKSDEATSTLTTEDGKNVGSTDVPPESPVEDVVTSTLMSDSEKGNNNEDTDTTTGDANQTMSGTTITDFLVPTSVNNDAQTSKDEGSETSVSKPDKATSGTTMLEAKASTSAEEELVTTPAIQTTLGSTISDELAPALANDDLQVSNDAGGETIAPEPTEETLAAEIADVLAPAMTSNISQIINDGGSTINEAESNESTSTKADSPEPAFSEVVQISDDANSESTAVETKSTQTTLGFSTDVDEPSNEVSETTAAETTQTSGSTVTAEASTTLPNTDEQNTNTESSGTTMENADLMSGASKADGFSSSVTASHDQVTNKEGSESMAESQNEVVDFSISMNAEEQSTTASSLELSCPIPCVCITEGDSSDYIVDCSDRALTDLPGPIDPKTTTLKLQNNVLSIMPKEISQLKNLKILNASDNHIFELELGSVSELPELVTLNLANNRLHEYPEDLQYPFALNKLEELNLAGNDLIATPKMLLPLNNKALKTVTLPEASSELAAELCMSLKETLAAVCSKSCEKQTFKCYDAFVQTSDTLPGMIPFIPKMLDEDTKGSEDISGNTQTSDTSITSPVPKSTEALSAATKDTKSGLKENEPVNEFSLRTAVNNAPNEKVALQNIVIDTPKDSTNNETDVKVGAKTTETKAAGGVDKSVIAVIVAGMIIIIAIITIKKNWSSIRNRFGSTPRPNDRFVRNTNGTTPEEVPLQDKSLQDKSPV